MKVSWLIPLMMTGVIIIGDCDSVELNSFDMEMSFAQSFKTQNPKIIYDVLKDLASPARAFVKGKTFSLNQLQRNLICSACRGGIKFFLKQATKKGFSKTVKRLKRIVCPALGLLNIFPKKICQDTIDVFVPEIKYLFENDKLESHKMCTLVIGSQCSDFSSLEDWSIDLDHASSEPQVQQSRPTTQNPSRNSKILQITDIHLDLEYVIGSQADCPDPICCRQGTSLNPKNKAKKWGHPNCDLPLWTFEKILEHIKETNPEGFEYIFLTGDNTAHNIWSQSRTENMNYSKVVFDLMKETFPEQMIFPIVGNHETFPVNSFPPSSLQSPDLEPSWMYNGLANLSSTWLSEKALSTFKDMGHYSEILRPGLRVIVINSNVCSNLNFWLNYDHVDLGGQLQWLLEALTQAEKDHEKVHLLSHVPPGSEECYGTWGREFTRIVNRFKDTILAQFYGHTHVDEFVLFFDESSQPTNVGFVTPSITTYSEVNPSYRIFTMDSSNEIIDYDTYILDLEESNESSTSDVFFKKLYNAREDLEMESLSPSSYLTLIKRLINDEEFYQKYERFVVSNGTLAMERKDVICRLVTTSSYDHEICEKMTSNLN